MSEQLDDLQKRLQELKRETASDEPKADDSLEEKSDLGRAYELIATPIVTGALGAGVDHLFSTKPIFFITLAFLGLLAGFWNIYKASQNIVTPIDSKRLQGEKKTGKRASNFDSNKKD